MMVAKPNTKTKPLKIQWFDMMAAKPNITLTSRTKTKPENSMV